MSANESGLIDIDTLSREVMDTVLGPYIRFDPQRKEFVLTMDWYALDNRRKILAYLVARKATSARGLLDAGEAASPKMVAGDTGLPSGSVNHVLAEMYKARDVEKDDGRRYFVPNRALLKVKVMYGTSADTGEPAPRARRKVRAKAARKTSKGRKEQ